MLEFNKLKENDKEIYDAVMGELSRQQNKIELIASENFVSETVMETLGTHLTNKYAEGKPHKRYYNGCEVVDKIEELAPVETIDAQGMPRREVDILIERIQKIRAEIPEPDKQDVSPEEQAFTEAYEEQYEAMYELHRNRMRRRK